MFSYFDTMERIENQSTREIIILLSEKHGIKQTAFADAVG